MAQPGSEAIWLWIGTALMFLGMVAFIWLGRDVRDEKMQQFFVVTIFVPAIAFTSYLSMALGFGLTQVEVGGMMLDIYWARYADWLFTTPLLLIDLALLAGASRTTMGTLVGLDVAMIVTGIVAALEANPTSRIVWWGISTGFLLVLLYFLVGQLSTLANERGGAVGSTFNTLKWMTIGLWSLYPILWIVGTEGALGSPGIVPLYWETAGFMVLDVTAKVGFGFVLLRSRSTLQEAIGSTEIDSDTETDADGTPA